MNMHYEEYMEKLQDEGGYHCTCFINPPCTFCTDTAYELYEEYCKENNIVPQY